MTLVILGMGEPRTVPVKGRVWALPWDREGAVYAERLFEMHDRSIYQRRGLPYTERLTETPTPIFMHAADAQVPASVRYPFEHVSSVVFANYPRIATPGYESGWYNSSLAYMLALALAEGERTIHLEGVMVKSGSEWEHEQPCLSYLCGWAAARGVTVTFDTDASDLLRFHPIIPFDGCPVRYAAALYGIPYPRCEPDPE